MAWYLAPALVTLRSEVNSRWPGRDKTSDGTIGDAAHQSSTSDHNPNSRESVNAWDLDKDGVDVQEVIAAFQRHPSAQYWIWQRQIASRDSGWRPRAYTGTNPHTLHVHFSIRQSAAAEHDTRPWGLEDSMTELTGNSLKMLQATTERLEAYVKGLTSHQTTWSDSNPTGTEAIVPNVKLAGIETKGNTVDTKVTALPALIANVDEATSTALTARFDAIDAQAVQDAERDTAQAAQITELHALVVAHADGTLDAEDVVRRMGELLNPPPPVEES